MVQWTLQITGSSVGPLDPDGTLVYYNVVSSDLAELISRGSYTLGYCSRPGDVS